MTCKLIKESVNFKKIFSIFSFDGENFENAGPSKCDHVWTYGLGNYRQMALTTGSKINSDCYVRTEIYNFETNQWSDAADYPFAR